MGGSVKNEIFDLFSFITLVNELIKCYNDTSIIVKYLLNYLLCINVYQ